MINWWDGRWSDRKIEWKDRNGLQGGVWFRELGVLIVVYLMIYMFFFSLEYPFSYIQIGYFRRGSNNNYSVI